MKKKYIKPFTEMIETKTENLLAGHSYDHTDGKLHDFFEEDDPEPDPWHERQYNMWEE
jgi:hypothetical protein